MAVCQGFGTIGKDRPAVLCKMCRISAAHGSNVARLRPDCNNTSDSRQVMEGSPRTPRDRMLFDRA
jgi:hypothetical protein